MVRVSFTPHLRLHVDCPDLSVTGETVSLVLEQVFQHYPRLRGYVLDDQSCLRKHVTIFVNNEPVRDRLRLTDAVQAGDQVFVFQALSGG